MSSSSSSRSSSACRAWGPRRRARGDARAPRRSRDGRRSSSSRLRAAASRSSSPVERVALRVEQLAELLAQLSEGLAQVHLAVAAPHLLAQLLEEIVEPHDPDAVLPLEPLVEEPVERLLHVVGGRTGTRRASRTPDPPGGGPPGSRPTPCSGRRACGLPYPIVEDENAHRKFGACGRRGGRLTDEGGGPRRAPARERPVAEVAVGSDEDDVGPRDALADARCTAS